MTHAEMRAAIGITQVNYVSRTTIVLELAGGGARPATELERRMIKLLDSVYEDA